MKGCYLIVMQFPVLHKEMYCESVWLNKYTCILCQGVACSFASACLGCGHCKQLAPVYEELGQTYKNEPNCVVARVDADGNKDLGSR